MDISNGPGIRVSLFVQGCPIHCPGCFNSETWNPEKGEAWTLEIQEKLLSLCKDDHISGLSILGGEPLAEYNITSVTLLCYEFRRLFPKKTIWVWSGLTEDQIKANTALYSDLLSQIDNLVIGPFEASKKDAKLAFRGSSNQKIIDTTNGQFVDVTNVYDSKCN